MSVNSLRESRKGATVIFTQFTRLKEKYAYCIFCGFEGDDAKYYFQRIENYTKYSPDEIIVFNCGGKAEVLRLYKLISEKSEYDHVNFAYFIDKDFDPSLHNDKLYETDTYSVENNYTTLHAFKRILQCEFSYNFDDTEFDWLVDTFEKRQKDFHEATLLFNAWLSCQRDKSNNGGTPRVNLDNFQIQKIIPEIGLDRIVANYDKSVLQNMFPEAAILSEEELIHRMDTLKKENFQKVFRGKFEIDFLFAFLEGIKLEFKKSSCRCKKKDGVQLNQSKKNMISEFSQYACTPESLEAYLNLRKKTPS